VDGHPKTDTYPGQPASAREIAQAVASDLVEMIKRHTPLNEQEQRLMDSLIAEIGTKYQILPPVEGFKAERIEEKLPKEWF